MQPNFSSKSLRPFIGSKDFETSRSFYCDLGFEEFVIDPKMSVFKMGEQAFYLQDYYAEDWVGNTMLFLEVENVDIAYREIEALNLPAKYEGVRLIPIKNLDWGREFFLYDPAGILWHIGEFKD
ncbi:glyoxalase [Flavobacterium sp. J372]|nr:glyoxalase [Flavobacterium sp. J372]